MEQLTELEKRVLATFEELVPKMTQMDLEKLEAFGSGLAFSVERESKSA